MQSDTETDTDHSEDEIRVRPRRDGGLGPYAWPVRIAGVLLYVACLGAFVIDVDVPVTALAVVAAVGVTLIALPALLDIHKQATGSDAEDEE